MMSILDDEILLGYTKKNNNSNNSGDQQLPTTSNSININQNNNSNNKNNYFNNSNNTHFTFDDLVNKTPSNSYTQQNSLYNSSNAAVNNSGNYYSSSYNSNPQTPNQSYGSYNNTPINVSTGYYSNSFNQMQQPQSYSQYNTPTKTSINLDDDDEFFAAIRGIDKSSSSKLGDSTSQLYDSTASYTSPSPLSGSTTTLPSAQSDQQTPEPLSLYKENLYASFVETDPINLKNLGELVKEDSDTFNHVISEKDTLQGLSIRYNCTVEELKQLNKLVTNSIHERSILVIPRKRNQTPQQKEDIFNNKDMEETMRRRVIGRFMKITGCTDQDQAIYYLEKTTFDFYKSVHDYQKESNIEIEFPKPVPTSPLKNVPLSILAQQNSPQTTVSTTGTTYSSSSPHDILNNSDMLINSFKDLYGSKSSYNSPNRLYSSSSKAFF